MTRDAGRGRGVTSLGITGGAGLAVLCLRNLARRPRRTALTVLGVALATAAYIVLISLGEALVREIQGTVNLLGRELTVQQAGVGFPEMSWLSAEQVAALGAMPHVASVMTVALTTTRLPGGSHFFLFGLGPAEPRIPGMRLRAGRPFAPGTPEVMFGFRAAETMGVTVGQVIELRRRQLTVAGIYDSGRGMLDRGVLAPVGIVQEMFNLGERVNLAFLELDEVASQSAVTGVIERRLPDLEVSPTDTWTSSYRQVDIIGQFVRRLALVALLITALGVSNVLTISVAERTGELGVLRAIGWRPRRLFALVLGEGLVTAAAGALLGIPLASLILGSLQALESLGLASDQIPLAAAVEGVALTLVAAALGSLPALVQALRIRPATALRAV